MKVHWYSRYSLDFQLTTLPCCIAGGTHASTAAPKRRRQRLFQGTRRSSPYILLGQDEPQDTFCASTNVHRRKCSQPCPVHAMFWSAFRLNFCPAVTIIFSTTYLIASLTSLVMLTNEAMHCFTDECEAKIAVTSLRGRGLGAGRQSAAFH